MTRSFDHFYQTIMEDKSPQQHTKEVLLKYGQQLRKLQEKMMNSGDIPSRYDAVRRGFIGVGNELMEFYRNRRNEIEEDDTLSTIFDVIYKMIEGKNEQGMV